MSQLPLSGTHCQHTWHLSRYVTSHPGQLGLAIPLWVGAISTSQRAVMLCGWEYRQVMVCVWVTRKPCDPLVTHAPCLSCTIPILRDSLLYVTGFPLSWLKKFPGLFQDSPGPRSIFPGPCRMSVMFSVTKNTTARHRRRQDNGLLDCSCTHCSTPYTAQYTLALVY